MNEVETLSRFFPVGAVEQVYDWIKNHRVHFRITRSRNTKLGDYRPPSRNGGSHRITVNHDLNAYAFLITFVHEMAHLKIHEQYGRSVRPHGQEWKQAYRSLMLPLLDRGIFPKDLQSALRRSLNNAKASSTGDLALSRVLARYDKPSDHLHLEDLGQNQVFMTTNGRRFRKGERIRTRIKCLNLDNKRYYLFHPLTRIKPVTA
ncbi:MAG: SprT-like domain-containing protein [bacterium]